MKAIEQFIERISSLELPGVFNPYSDQCSLHDRKDGPAIRRENLRGYLRASISTGVDSMWFGRDLGYRGGRRTGIALTDEAHLPLLAMLCDEKIERATNGYAVSERTATVVWGMIAEIGQLPFLWNAFPFHPHEVGDPMTNRTHSRNELEKIWDINQALLDLLQPNRFVAIGNDARSALARQGLECEYVRHPSYGGQTEFTQGLRAIYHCDISRNIRINDVTQQTLTFAD